MDLSVTVARIGLATFFIKLQYMYNEIIQFIIMVNCGNRGRHGVSSRFYTIYPFQYNRWIQIVKSESDLRPMTIHHCLGSYNP